MAQTKPTPSAAIIIEKENIPNQYTVTVHTDHARHWIREELPTFAAYIHWSQHNTYQCMFSLLTGYEPETVLAYLLALPPNEPTFVYEVGEIVTFFGREVTIADRHHPEGAYYDLRLGDDVFFYDVPEDLLV